MYQQNDFYAKCHTTAQIINVQTAFLCKSLIIRRLPPHPPPDFCTKLIDNQLVVFISSLKNFLTRCKCAGCAFARAGI